MEHAFRLLGGQGVGHSYTSLSLHCQEVTDFLGIPATSRSLPAMEHTQQAVLQMRVCLSLSRLRTARWWRPCAVLFVNVSLSTLHGTEAPRTDLLMKQELERSSGH